MSGIAGIVYLDEVRNDHTSLQFMADKLKHRGLNGVSIYRNESVGLIHCMLYDTEESFLEILPLVSTNNELIITFHGRIDNRSELYSKTKLQKPIKITTDSELVIEVYQKWGNRCVEHILGDFSFAIWNKMTKTLFCARDHFGVKPFFYYKDSSLFAFATEIGAILSIQTVQAKLNMLRAAAYFTCVATDSYSTFFENIYQLEPASSLEVSRNGFRKRKYWSLVRREVLKANDKEYEEEFREIFFNAVSCRLRSVYPIGSFLSGGLDSSSIVTAACQLRGESLSPINTFSGIFNTIKSCDEREYFSEIIRENNIKAHFVKGDQISPEIAFTQLSDLSDEPFRAAHFFLQWNLSKLIKKEGVRVVLDGHDGDSCISYGYGLLTELALKGKVFHLAKELKCIRGGNNKKLARSILSIYKNAFVHFLPRSHRFIASQRASVDSKEILTQQCIENTNITEYLIALMQKLPAPGLSEMNVHFKNISQPLHQFTLNVLERMGAYHNYDLRFPFFDIRLIQFCLSLPATQKLRLGLNRNIVRRSLADILPDSTANRKTKTNFTPNLLRAYRIYGRKWLISELDSIPQPVYTIVDKVFVQNTLRRFLFEEDNSSHSRLLTLLKLISFSRWFKKFKINL